VSTTVKMFALCRCPTCGLDFQPVTWLAWRAAGYCTSKCVPTEKQLTSGRAAAQAAPAERVLGLFESTERKREPGIQGAGR
jgi:hypothetical protein